MKLIPHTNNLKPELRNGVIAVVIYYTLLFLFIGTGIYARLFEYSSAPLWFDEAARAILMCNPMELFKEDVALNGTCSVGYILLNSVIAVIYNTDYTLRLTSLIPSIISIILVYGIAVQLTDNKIIHLLAVFSVSLNPLFIFYAKELKPYSLELMLHLVNIFLLLLYLKDKSFRNLAILIGCAYFTLYFATNIIFLYPAMFLTVGLDSILNKKWKHLAFIGVAGCICLISISFLYIVLFYKAPSIGELTDMTKNLFYLRGEAGGPFSFTGFSQWICSRFNGMIVDFNSQKVFFNHAEIFERTNKIIIPALYLLGIIVSLIKKEYKYLIIFLLPVLTVVLFALPLPAKWPFGWTRINMFMFGYCFFLVMLGLKYLLSVSVIKYFTYLYIIILFVIHIPLNMNFDIPFNVEDILSPLAYLNENETKNNTEKELLCVNYAGDKAFQYYTIYNTVTSKKFKNIIENRDILIVPNAYDNYNKMDEQMREVLKQRKNIWFLYSHLLKRR